MQQLVDDDICGKSTNIARLRRSVGVWGGVDDHAADAPLHADMATLVAKKRQQKVVT